MIISFAWTTKALLAGEKTVTRRMWKRSYMRSWEFAWYGGRRRHQAYDKLPYRGGSRLGEIELTCCPYWERLCDMPEEDLAAEGGLWPTLDDFIAGFVDRGCLPTDEVAVVRFEFVPMAVQLEMEGFACLGS